MRSLFGELLSLPFIHDGRQSLPYVDLGEEPASSSSSRNKSAQHGIVERASSRGRTPLRSGLSISMVSIARFSGGRVCILEFRTFPPPKYLRHRNATPGGINNHAHTDGSEAAGLGGVGCCPRSIDNYPRNIRRLVSKQSWPRYSAVKCLVFVSSDPGEPWPNERRSIGAILPLGYTLARRLTSL